MRQRSEPEADQAQYDEEGLPIGIPVNSCRGDEANQAACVKKFVRRYVGEFHWHPFQMIPRLMSETVCWHIPNADAIAR
jgi:hypothetical protein